MLHGGGFAIVVFPSQCALAIDDEVAPPFRTPYRTAASACSYGGYGGNGNKRNNAEYTFEVLQGWKEGAINFQSGEKNEQYGRGVHVPRDNVLNSLALSNVKPARRDGSYRGCASGGHDARLGAVVLRARDQSLVAHELINVTYTKNKLRQNATGTTTMHAMLCKVHDFFSTIGEEVRCIPHKAATE